jgi:hypothetical protein
VKGGGVPPQWPGKLVRRPGEQAADLRLRLDDLTPAPDEWQDDHRGGVGLEQPQPCRDRSGRPLWIRSGHGHDRAGHAAGDHLLGGATCPDQRIAGRKTDQHVDR